MQNLRKFKSNELSKNQASSLKGGSTFNFCEWYINQRAGKNVSPGQLNQAMVLDAILAADGYEAALAAGGSEFLEQWG